MSISDQENEHQCGEILQNPIRNSSHSLYQRGVSERVDVDLRVRVRLPV